MKQKSKRLSLLIRSILLILAIVISTSGVVDAADVAQAGNTSNDSFSKSKKLLHKAIYKEAASRVRTFTVAVNMTKRKKWTSLPADIRLRRTTNEHTGLNGSTLSRQRHSASLFQNGETATRTVWTIGDDPSRAASALRGSILNTA